MKKIYIRSGRFANQLYVILHAYIRQKINNEDIILCVDNTYYDIFLKCNMQNIITNNFIGGIDGGLHYLQEFNKDFTCDQLHQFINDTFLKSTSFKQKINAFKEKYDTENILCINIRNGDYLSQINKNDFSWFNREVYIQTALEKFKTIKYNKCFIVSDEIDLCKQKYSQIFNSLFKDVYYAHSSDVFTEFCFLCSFKNKILFNSTFSLWSAFISNELYQNSYSNIIAPSRLMKSCQQQDPHIDSRWNLIKV